MVLAGVRAFEPGRQSDHVVGIGEAANRLDVVVRLEGNSADSPHGFTPIFVGSMARVVRSLEQVPHSAVGAATCRPLQGCERNYLPFLPFRPLCMIGDLWG